MTDTQRALLNDKKLAPAAHHVLLSILVVTSPAPDVWLSILTDYTYDSELDIADGVPLAFRCSSMFPEGNTKHILSQSQIVRIFYFLWKRFHTGHLPINQVGDIAGNELSPTKQARGDNGKEPKLHQWHNGEKTLGETRLSPRSSSPARRTSSLFQLQQSQSVSGPLVPLVLPDGCLRDEFLTGDLSLGLI